MKVAVSSSGKDLNSEIDPRFGRCAFFLIVETDDMSFEAFDNENISISGGAGIQSAQFIASKGARAVITGNCGPNAVRTLAAAGIELFANNTGRLSDAIERYKNGELMSTKEATVSDHYGLQGESFGRGRGQGMGMVGGRGMGRGMGGGRGQGMGRGMGGSKGMGRSR
jgi:predicted Fe-Mo cluster-binding NifX family protein